MMKKKSNFLSFSDYMGDTAPEESEELSIIFQEDTRRRSVIIIGVILLLCFIFPIAIPQYDYSGYVSFHKGFSLEFPNFGAFKYSNPKVTLFLLFPLFAGILALTMGLNIKNKVRPLIFLASGLFFVFLLLLVEGYPVFQGSKPKGSIVTMMILYTLTLIGVFVGSKLILFRELKVARLIRGASALLFLGIILLPIQENGKSIIFELFNTFKSSHDIFIGICFILIHLALILATVLSIINYKARPNSKEHDYLTYKLVLFSGMAIPLSFLVNFAVFSTGISFTLLFTSFIKIILLFGGIIGLISMGLWDLLDQLAPLSKKTVAPQDSKSPKQKKS
jgi:hypothetical protein